MGNDSLIIDNIPFLYLPSPPNIYDLKKVEREAREGAIKRPFLDWRVQEAERKQLLGNKYSPKGRTVYVSRSDIISGKLNSRDRVMGSHPALLDLQDDRERVEKHAGTPQFSFGLYYAQNELFLIEDIIKWSHCRIYWRQVRTFEKLTKQYSAT